MEALTAMTILTVIGCVCVYLTVRWSIYLGLKKIEKALAPYNTRSDKDGCDYTLEEGDEVWFTYLLAPDPQKPEDWRKAKILSLNWAFKAAAIKIEGYKGISVHGIASLSKNKTGRG